MPCRVSRASLAAFPRELHSLGPVTCLERRRIGSAGGSTNGLISNPHLCAGLWRIPRTLRAGPVPGNSMLDADQRIQAERGSDGGSLKRGILAQTMTMATALALSYDDVIGIIAGTSKYCQEGRRLPDEAVQDRRCN